MNVIAQNYSVQTSGSINGGVLAVIIVAWIAFAVFMIVSMWKIFEKAGEPGWYAIIPILNTYTLIKISGKPGWWLILMFIPCVSIVVAILVLIDLSAAFGKSGGFVVGLILLPFIFFPILAFGDTQYTRPYGAYGQGGYPPQQYAGAGYAQPQAGYGQAPAGWGPTPTADAPVTPTAPVAPSTTPAGWYPDPSGGAGQRYWDGTAWTDHTA